MSKPTNQTKTKNCLDAAATSVAGKSHFMRFLIASLPVSKIRIIDPYGPLSTAVRNAVCSRPFKDFQS